MCASISLQEMLQRLVPFAAQHGITFQEVGIGEDFPESDDVFCAPFSDHLGVKTPATVLYQEGAPVTGLIHEMGHLLFGIKEDEYRWFGWEWTVARLLEVEEQWFDESADYVVFEDGEDCDLCWVKNLPRLYEERVAAAAKEKIPLPSLTPSNNLVGPIDSV